MKILFKIVLAMAVLLAFFIDCTENGENTEEGESVELTAMQGEHTGHSHDESTHEHGEGGEHGGAESGEESGTQFGPKDTYDNIRNGARLILSYDAKSNAFTGTVENMTKELLKNVRVEVHLSNGKELGPTTPTDLKPGHKRSISLKAISAEFKSWSAHPEVGSGEHGHSHEHGEEGEHEHK